MEEKRIPLWRAFQIYSRFKRGRMAWRCSGRTNQELVANLEASRIFAKPRVREALLHVDRGDFTSNSPYVDSPQGIGYNATISAPHMGDGLSFEHAAALEKLEGHLRPGAAVLDVGSGSGYLTACFAHMVSPGGVVVGIEHIDQLVELSKRNVAKKHENFLSSGLIRFVCGDGRLGHPLPDGRLYDAIHVGAAAATIPQQLVEQLAPGGRMLIPVGGEGGGQEFVQVDKDVDGKVHKKTIEHVIYVPLTSKDHQLRR